VVICLLAVDVVEGEMRLNQGFVVSCTDVKTLTCKHRRSQDFLWGGVHFF